MIATLNRNQIDNLLHGQVVGRIGCYLDKKVYVVPISYAYDGNYIYCHTILGMKVEFMRANPNVCFEVEHIQYMANWQSAILWGKYEELEGDQREKGLRILINKIHPLMISETIRPGQAWEQHSSAVQNNKNTIVFRIKVEEAKGKFEKQ